MADALTVTIQVIQAIAVLVLGIGLILLARAILRAKHSLDRLDRALETLTQDARPVMDRARAIGENLNFIAMSVRKEVDRVGETIELANQRLEDAIDSAEERVQELGALIDVVQGEVQDTLLTATSAIRGIRTGARMLRRRGRNDNEENEVEDESRG